MAHKCRRKSSSFSRLFLRCFLFIPFCSLVATALSPRSRSFLCWSLVVAAKAIRPSQLVGLASYRPARDHPPRPTQPQTITTLAQPGNSRRTPPLFPQPALAASGHVQSCVRIVAASIPHVGQAGCNAGRGPRGTHPPRRNTPKGREGKHLLLGHARPNPRRTISSGRRHFSRIINITTTGTERDTKTPRIDPKPRLHLSSRYP
ncbi:hypothetical protein VTK73DRAFT_8761 [Phialemonium thermophilum]|uniref:Secreted protein n=1 Tax=Phialemonium thermophilum TaxID=223376 RepID=A0ABR3W6I0_9PEZI